MHLSAHEWKEIEIRERERRVAIPARIHRVAGPHAEKMAVLELQAAFPGAAALRVRMEPLVPEERLLSLAYPNGELRFASGRFAQYGTEENRAGTALIEMHDGNDRLVLDHGASGAPVLDCEGRVVAVVSTLITQTIALPTGPGARFDGLADPQRRCHPCRGAEGFFLVRVRPVKRGPGADARALPSGVIAPVSRVRPERDPRHRAYPFSQVQHSRGADLHGVRR